MQSAEPVHEPVDHQPLGAFLEALGAPTPDPGGGAAAGVTIALGAALTRMVGGYVHAPADRERLCASASAAQQAALTATDADGRASGALVRAFRLPSDAPDRAAAILSGSLAAADTSAALVRIAADLTADLDWLAEHGDERVAADVAVAARLLAAGIRSAAVNLRCNRTAAADFGADAAALHSLDQLEIDARSSAVTLEALAERVTETL